MTDGIGNIYGYGNYGVGGYVPQRKGGEAANNKPEEEQPARNYEETQVDPAKVMDFLAKNNYFIGGPTEAAPAGNVDAATADRVAGYMEQFQMIYAVVVEEFGEGIAPDVMDAVMDRLMGMAD